MIITDLRTSLLMAHGRDVPGSSRGNPGQRDSDDDPPTPNFWDLHLVIYISSR